MANEVKTEEVKVPNEVKSEKTSVLQTVPTWGLFVGAALVFFAVIGLVSVCFSLMHTVDRRADYRPMSSDVMERETDGGMPGRFDGGVSPRSGMGGRMMGGMDSVDSDTRLSGVVAAVNGDVLTVVGNGTTTKVTVSDATTFVGDDKPAVVNDTIMVFGTKNSDGSFTASNIRLTRQ